MKTDMQETIANSVRARREAFGMSQRDLAKAVGFGSHQIVSDLERGQRAVKAWELDRIARALHTPLAALMGLGSSSRTEPRVFWRLTAPSDECCKREAHLLERLERYRRVEEVVGAADQGNSLPQYRLERNASFGQAEQMASRARRNLDLGNRPALSLAGTLEEKFRVKIFFDDLGYGGPAACVRTERDAAVVLDRNEAPWRQRFSLAHELFYLLTWNAVLGDQSDAVLPPTWIERLEKLANVFASAVLLPGDVLRLEYQADLGKGGSLDFILVNLARSYGVSTEALLWRLRGLGLMAEEAVREKLGDPVFRGFDGASMAAHWTGPPPDLPQRLVRLVVLAYQAGDLSRATVARYLEKNPAELHYLDWDDDACEFKKARHGAVPKGP